jgi:hypothetical protein
MARAVIAYDKDLPEIPGRLPWQKPTQHLLKDEKAPNGWRSTRQRSSASARAKRTSLTSSGSSERRHHGEAFRRRAVRHPCRSTAQQSL